MLYFLFKKDRYRRILWIALLLMCQPPLAATSLANSKAYQDMSQVRTVLLTFLSEQAMGSPEKSVVTIGEIDPALKLPA